MTRCLRGVFWRLAAQIIPAPSGIERLAWLRIFLNLGFLAAVRRISGFGVTIWCWPFCSRKSRAIWVASLRVTLSNFTPRIFGIGRCGFCCEFL